MVATCVSKRVVFRVDASVVIGTGHVMRCLTLAQALAAGGAECHFICREHSGHLIDAIRSRGFRVHVLSVAASKRMASEDELVDPPHAGWLDASWQEDAQHSRARIDSIAPDWLVVDHYALDKRWEEAVVPAGCRLVVIDDLADREHACDLLLDQNLGRLASDYTALVPLSCGCLIGPEYALLRPEFAQLREASLARRAKPQLTRLLVTMGGVDKDNATGAVLSGLQDCPLPEECHITVVMGASAPWVQEVKDQAANMPWHTEVVVNVGNMAQRMCDADLAVGAAGSTSWERCSLGVPTVTIVLADNQRAVGRALESAGATLLLGVGDDIKCRLPEQYAAISLPNTLQAMSNAAAVAVDGHGASRVCLKMRVSRGERLHV